MHQLSTLCYMLEDEIGRITQKGDISPAELDNVYKATKTIYYAKVIEAMEESKHETYDGYSGRRMMISYDRGPYYDGRSYDRQGDDSKEEMRRHIEMAMGQAKTEPERKALMECLQKL